MIQALFNRNAKKKMQMPETLKLGEKTVRIRKVTPAEYKELMAVIGNLPNLIVQVVQAPEEERLTYIMTALDVGMDDLINVTSTLSNIDADYLTSEGVGLDEIVEYVTQMAKFNEIGKTIKNLASLLPKATAE
ncbi:hypothetical protein BK703_16880 [Bacillus thuringiensis serovar silo]|uniref:hypothetical protein n=1 Tax=Bacillus thuringiensis TaxID=1428 RepID=UPI000A3BCDCF|nr:hypothetical protein [Bacillus thuringiensis]MED3275396.1 hypothetical protein [Bacillus thuringiensis]OTW55313.1 hypothetical protein BK703_16880 [Bacillus thuringiensis serovar silo]OTW74255.1 hypothetical protein BK700_01165 [Bacillus thuringiensis serovar toguchini]